MVKDRVKFADVTVTNEVTKNHVSLAEAFACGLDATPVHEGDEDYDSGCEEDEADDVSCGSIVMSEEYPIDAFKDNYKYNDVCCDAFQAQPEKAVELTSKQKQALARIMNCSMDMYGERKHNGEFCNFECGGDGNTGICKIAFQDRKSVV